MLQAALGSVIRSADRSIIASVYLDFRGDGLTRPFSNPVASLPDVKNKRGDQGHHDQHPVLDFETQKGEMPNEKLHRPRLLFCAE
jgi:hypothetical protein